MEGLLALDRAILNLWRYGEWADLTCLVGFLIIVTIMAVAVGILIARWVRRMILRAQETRAMLDSFAKDPHW